MEIIDGINPNKVPTVLTENQFNALCPEYVATYSPEWKARKKVYIYKIGEDFITAEGDGKVLILCKKHKTERGARVWVSKYYEHAIKIA